MHLDSPDDVADFARTAAGRLDHRVKAETARPIIQPGVERVADAPAAFLVDGCDPSRDCVLILSNPSFPDMVARAVACAREAKERLGPALGRPVCTPLLAGSLRGRTYALYPRLSGFSGNRVLRKLQVMATSGAILQWLASAHRTTRVVCVDGAERTALFDGPLARLAEDVALSDPLRTAARTFRSRLAAGEFDCFTCLQHGDFWAGNVMFQRHALGLPMPLSREFRVIDWAGARIDGYAGIDAVRFILSVDGQGRNSSKMMAAYCAEAGMSRLDLVFHCLCALGRLSQDLDQFPRDRFSVLAESVFGFLDARGAIAVAAPGERSVECIQTRR